MTVATAEKWTTIASDSPSGSRCSPSMTTAVHTAAARAQAVAVEVSMGVATAAGATSSADPRLTRKTPTMPQAMATQTAAVGLRRRAGQESSATQNGKVLNSVTAVETGSRGSE